jgi:hypothetical protein
MSGVIIPDPGTGAPLPLTDLGDIEAMRAYFEVKPIQDFIEYLNWGTAAANVIKNGDAPPPAPVRLPDLEFVTGQLQKIDNYITMLAGNARVSPPDGNALKPAPDLQQKVRDEVSRQAAYMYGLNSSAELLQELQGKLTQVEQASYNIKDSLLSIMSWFGDNQVPLPGGTVLNDALVDLDINIPKAVTNVLDHAKAQSIQYQQVIGQAKGVYAAWDAMAENFAKGWDYKAYKQQQQQSIDDAGADAKGTQVPSGDGGTVNTGNGKVTFGGLSNEISDIPGVPSSVTVDVYVLRADWDPYPPLEPPVTIPSGGSITALTMFPADETTIDIYAVQSDGTWSLLQSFRGGNGAVGEPLYWKNELDVPVTIQALSWQPGEQPAEQVVRRKLQKRELDAPVAPAYSAYPEQNREYLDRSTKFSFNQLAVFSWGYLPEGVDPPPFGSPNSAILLIAKSDVLSTDARPSLLPMTHFVTLEQLNVLAEAQFLGRPMNINFPGVEGGADFWTSLSGAIKDNFSNVITLGSPANFVFAGEIENPGGAPLPTHWDGQWFNPELLVVGVGGGVNTQPFDALVLISIQRAPVADLEAAELMA